MLQIKRNNTGRRILLIILGMIVSLMIIVLGGAQIYRWIYNGAVNRYDAGTPDYALNKESIDFYGDRKATWEYAEADGFLIGAYSLGGQLRNIRLAYCSEGDYSNAVFKAYTINNNATEYLWAAYVCKDATADKYIVALIPYTGIYNENEADKYNIKLTDANGFSVCDGSGLAFDVFSADGSGVTVYYHVYEGVGKHDTDIFGDTGEEKITLVTGEDILEAVSNE